MKRLVEFALVTAVISIVHIILAFYIADLTTEKVSELFNTILETFPL